MKSSFAKLNLTTLESRENPAVITASLAGGTLTLTGTDAADEIRITDTGTDIVVDGLGTTTIGNNVDTTQTYQNITSVKILLKGGDDILRLGDSGAGTDEALTLTGLFSADLGNGNNQFLLTSTDTIGLATVMLKGGSGNDTVQLGNATAATGSITADLGAGNNSTTIESGTNITGDLKVVGLGGSDQLTVTDSNITKNVNLMFGAGGSTTTLTTVAITGNLSFTAGTGADDITLNAVTVSGAAGTKLTLGSGANQLTFTGNSQSTAFVVTGAAGGSITATLNANANLTASGNFAITGASSIKLDLADDSILTAPKTTITALNDFVYTGTATSALSFGGLTNLKARSITADFLGQLTALDSFNINATDNLKVTMDGTVDISKMLNIKNSGPGTTTFLQQGGTINVIGATTISSGAGSLDAKLNGTSFTGANLLLSSKGEVNTVVINTTNASSLSGTFTYKGGSEEDTVSIDNLVVTGDANVNLGNGKNTLTINNVSPQPNFNAKLTITGGADVDTISLLGVRVAGNTMISTLAGNDALSVDGVTGVGGSGAKFTGSFVVDMGKDDDSLSFGQVLGMDTDDAVEFAGVVTVKGGDGNDSLLIGLDAGAGGDAKSLVNFSSTVKALFDLGANLNTFDAANSQKTAAAGDITVKGV